MFNMDNMHRLVEIIKKETIPALGCTEPVAVAYAVSVANKYLKGTMKSVDIRVSKNIFKNGKSVLIPNTGERGLDLAGGLGALCGDPEAGLMVLKNVDQDSIDKGHKLIDEGKIRVNYIEKSPDVYVEVLAKSENTNTRVILKDSHDNIEKVEVNGEIIYSNAFEKKKTTDKFLKELSLKEIKTIVETVDIEEIEFIKDGIQMNKKAAELGMENSKGMGIGFALNELVEEGILNLNSATKARLLTAAAADTRMGGETCPIMTSAGSGNQGLGVVLPIVVVAEENQIEEDKLIRAIFFAHIINKYVKLFTGKLSYMCGCGIAAGVGASAGISWMLGGNLEQISGACNNMLANLTGMICDGAKETCALKLATSAEEAVISAYLANKNIMPEGNMGIIGDTVEKSIRNIGELCEAGLPSMDSAIINIID